MTQPSKSTSNTAQQKFIDRLARLERGPLAELRRSLSDTPGSSAHFLEREIYAADIAYLDRRAMYLIAGLYALIERPHDEETPQEIAKRERYSGKSMGHLLGTLYRDQGKRPSTEKRFLVLLDADDNALPYQLRQAVALLKGSEIKPDWVRLLHDISGWSKEGWGERVRRHWAIDFYRASDQDDSQTPETPAEETP